MDTPASSPFGPPELRADLNQAPGSMVHVHLMGVCGTGMASLAGLLKEKGLHITGSDRNVYPPMSDFLKRLDIPVSPDYSPANLATRPDLVIVGNVITRDNPEAVELARLALPYLSLPQALRLFAIGDRRSLVIAGTHGKTTTSALAAWVLETAGMDPGFMIGGIPGNFPANFKRGAGPCFVIEGDEYDTAFFDKGPKFLHYVPWAAVITSIEFDHADIYRDMDHLLASFRALIARLPTDGLLIANADDVRVADLACEAPCPVMTYGLHAPADWSMGPVVTDAESTRVELHPPSMPPIPLETPLYGRHNMGNLMAVAALSVRLGIPAEAIQRAAQTFQGVKRRQEVRGERRGVRVIDDFAHHPTAVRETIAAVREKHEGRRIVAVFEPRSNSSRRNVFQNQYAESFDSADMVFIVEPPLMERIPPEDRFSSSTLVKDLLRRGLNASYAPNTDALLKEILDRVRPGDVVLAMSNGAFDHIHERLLNGLEDS